MSKFFIIDTSLSKGGKKPVYIFDTVPELITHLEGTCQRHFGQSRKQYMYSVLELGFGDDDSAGKHFFEQMEQYFHMGVIRGDSTPIKCNVFDASRFSKTKEVHGN